jgi:hypothetical protein
MTHQRCGHTDNTQQSTSTSVLELGHFIIIVAEMNVSIDNVVGNRSGNDRVERLGHRNVVTEEVEVNGIRLIGVVGMLQMHVDIGHVLSEAIYKV